MYLICEEVTLFRFFGIFLRVGFRHFFALDFWFFYNSIGMGSRETGREMFEEGECFPKILIYEDGCLFGGLVRFW